MTAPLTDDELHEFAEIHRANGLNVSASARAIGMTRPGAQRRVRLALERGILCDEEAHAENSPKRDEYLSARARKLQAFERKEAKGDWRSLVPLNLPGRPFRLKIFGDPHLDDDGCDFDLFERHWLEMNAEQGVYGICVGDWFNNWLRALGHLWKEHSTAPSDSWLLLEGLMEERGDALLAACSGNHDDWSHGPIDPVAYLMRQHGVAYRKGAIRLELRPGNHTPLTIAMRHKWRGASMYSAAHGIRRAVEKGWADDIAIGGHIHQDESRHYIHPDTGKITTICQVSAFKAYDDHVDVQGYQGPRISPVWDLVIDPACEENDPDKVKVFWDSARAQKYLEAIR